jgi:hypothetical protein
VFLQPNPSQIHSEMNFKQFIPRKNKKNIFSSLINLLIILSLVCYPLSASISLFFNIPSTPINTAYRVLILSLSIVLLLLRLIKNDRKNVEPGFVIFLLFWFVYGLRLFYDVGTLGIRYGKYDADYVYSFAFGVCFIPSLTILLNLKYIKLKELSEGLFTMTAISNALIFFFLFKKILDGSFDPTTLRAELGGEGNSTFNPILIGFYGEILSLFILAKIFIEKKPNNKFFLIPLLLLGLTNLILGGSRGPILGFALVFIIIIIFHLKVTKINSHYLVRALLIVIMCIAVFMTYLIPLIESSQLTLFKRVGEFEQSRKAGETEIRDDLLSEAWQMFLSNPIIGDQFLTRVNGYYPHNFIVEVFMSTGIIGALFFFGFFLLIVRQIYTTLQQINYNISLILILFSSYIIYNMTSGSLFLTNEFWAVCTLSYGLTVMNNHEHESSRI